jgi:hypothetical protein
MTKEDIMVCKMIGKIGEKWVVSLHGKGYCLYMDTSDFGIGTVLQQIQPIRIRNLQGTQLYNHLQKLH